MSSKATICVVDDEAVITELLSEGLRAHNFDALTATSGQQALDICKENNVDLMLLDIMMPGLDGYEVCEQLKSDPATKDITVIFVTGKNEPEHHQKGFDLGAVDYITKPFNLPMVMVRVESALRMSQHSSSCNEVVNDLLDDIAFTDNVTGLKSQRYLLEHFQIELEKAKRYSFPVSCVIIDLDSVRATNDEVGTVSMDDLLAEVAMEIRKYTRSYDILSRYDGTLFTAVLPHTSLESALEYGEKIIQDIDATIFSDPNYPTKVAVSVSVVTIIDGAICDAERVFGETMITLLQAKSQPPNKRIVGREISPG